MDKIDFILAEWGKVNQDCGLDVNKMMVDMYSIIREAADKSIPLSKVSKKAKGLPYRGKMPSLNSKRKWFDKTCEEAKRAVQRSLRNLNRWPKNPDVRSKFYRNKKAYKQVIKSKKRSFKENLLKSIQETEDKNPKVFWNFVNDIKAKKRANPSDNIEPSVWYEWFKKLNESSVPLEDDFTLPISENIEKFTAAYDEILDSDISIDEISKATLKLKHKILLDDYKVRPELNKHKNI